MVCKLAKEVAAFLDIVVYMYKLKVDDVNSRLILTEATDEFICKDRTGKLPVVMQEPTMAEILKEIQKKTDKTED